MRLYLLTFMLLVACEKVPDPPKRTATCTCSSEGGQPFVIFVGPAPAIVVPDAGVDAHVPAEKELR